MESLRVSEAQCRAIFELTTVGMALTENATGKLVRVNQPYCELLGYRREELAARTFRDFTHPDDLAAELTEWNRLVAGEISAYTTEKRYIRKNGAIIWVKLTVSRMAAAGGDADCHLAVVQDISALKKTETTLKEIRALHLQAQHLAGVGHCTLDLRDHKLQWSDETLRIFELRENPPMDSHGAFLARIHPDDRERVDQAYKNHLAKRTRFDIIHRLRFTDGRIKFVHQHCETEFAPDGTPLRSFGTIQDVTTQTLSADLLRDRMRVQDAIADPGVALEKVLTMITRAMEHQRPSMMASVLLLSEDGKRLLHGAAPSLPDAYNRQFDGAAIGPCVASCGTAAFRGERIIVTDIETDPLWDDYRDLAREFGLRACWSQPIKDFHGRILGTFALYYKQPLAPDRKDIELIETMAGLARNAIECKHSEALMQRLTSLIELTSDFVGIADADQHMLYVNPAGRAMTGLAPEASLESLMVSDFHPATELEKIAGELIPQALQTGSWRGELLFRDRDGGEIPISAVFTVHRGDDGTPSGYSVIGRDMRKEREIQAKVEHTQRLESLGVLAGGIAHDFNNILAAVMGHAELASGKLPNSASAQKNLRMIVASSRRAAELCGQMLTYAGKGRVATKPIDLSDVVAEIAKLLEVSIPKRVKLKFDLASPLPPTSADAAQLQQIIMNLVINASEAMGERPGEIALTTGRMDIDAAFLAGVSAGTDAVPGSYVYLEVTDHGCGMDEKTRARLFEPFFTTKFTGRGLGMSAVLGIVNSHHGAIKLKSEVGQGTTFRVLLPATTPTPSVKPPVETEDPVPWRGSGTVLVVDDEPAIRDVATEMLVAMGYEILTAADGEQGVERYREHHDQIVAVLLDMTMPRMSGASAYRELRRINPAVKVILSSGYSPKEATRRLSGEDLAGFIQKPYTSDDLQRVMQQATQDRG